MYAAAGPGVSLMSAKYQKLVSQLRYSAWLGPTVALLLSVKIGHERGGFMNNGWCLASCNVCVNYGAGCN